MHLLDDFKMKPLSIVSNFDNANLSHWKVDQFIIVGLLAAVACMWISFYFSNVGKILQEQVLCDKYLGYVLYLL